MTDPTPRDVEFLLPSVKMPSALCDVNKSLTAVLGSSRFNRELLHSMSIEIHVVNVR